MRRHLIMAVTLCASATLGLACAEPVDDTQGEATSKGVEQPLAADAPSVVRGGLSYFGGFSGTGGNGRTCATCHSADDAFGLSPARVEQRYLAQRAVGDDPLFRSIDANDGASDFTNLRQHALIRVNFTLPTDAAGQKLMWPVDDPNATQVSVWRSVPSTRNVALTAPYNLDGRAPTLELQALGTLHAHTQITSEPSATALRDVANFQKQLFSSVLVARVASAIANGQPPPSADPPLNALEQAGKASFEHHCTSTRSRPTRRAAPGLSS